MRKPLLAVLLLISVAGGFFCFLPPASRPSYAPIVCALLGVSLGLWIGLIAVTSKATFWNADPSGVFKSILLLSASMAVFVVFPTVNHLLHEPGVSAFYALAAAFLLADFGGILFLVANALRTITSMTKTGATDSQGPLKEEKVPSKKLGTRDLDDLKALVLYMGLAAGAAVGILVGIDGYRKGEEQTGKEQVYTFILESIGLGAAAGVLIAVFVAVGMLVFIFEHKVRRFTDEAGELVKKVKDLSRDVKALDEEIKKSSDELKQVRPGITQASQELSLLANTLLGVPRIHEVEAGLPVYPEAYYLASWISRIANADSRAPETKVVRAIAETYWNEETSGVSRFRLVTTARNYLAFLIAAVNAISQSEPTRRVHFYTSTPAGPKSLLNWPQVEYMKYDHDTLVNFHSDYEFISSYMLFIKEIVRNKKEQIAHRRWIWTGTQESENQLGNKKEFKLFSDWRHYHRPDDHSYNDEHHVLGIPIGVPPDGTNDSRGASMDLAGVAAHVKNTLECRRHPLNQDDWKKWFDANGKHKSVQPIMGDAGKNITIWADLVQTNKDYACTKLNHLLDKLSVAARELCTPSVGGTALLTSDDLEFIRDRLAQAVQECSRGGGEFATGLPDVDETLMKLQKLEAALHLGKAQTAYKGDINQDIAATEKWFKWIKWWQFWQADHSSDTELPKFKSYFDKTFQTYGEPHLVSLEQVSNSEAIQTTGPEFALIGIETTKEQSDLTLIETSDMGSPNEVYIKWIVALKTTISAVWTNVEIELVLNTDLGFNVYKQAVEFLCQTSRLTVPKQEAQRA